MGEEVAVETTQTESTPSAEVTSEATAPVESGEDNSTSVSQLFGAATKPITKAEKEAKGDIEFQAKVEEKTEIKAEEKPKEETKPSVDVDQIIRERDGFKAAMFEEREKAKLAKARVAELETPVEDPVYVDDEVKKYVDTKVSESKQALQKAKLEMSVEMAKSQYKDYDEVSAVFIKAAENNPKLLESILAQSHPANAAYQEGKRLMFESKYGKTPDEIKQKIMAEAEVELRKKFQAELMGQVANKAKQPTSLVGARTSSGDSVEGWAPTTVSEMFTKR